MFIYAYSLHAYPNLIKIGQTKRSVKKRVEEQTKILPRVKNKKPYTILYELNDKELGINISDAEIHKELKQYHISGEWFSCTVTELKQAIEIIKNRKLNKGITYKENKPCKQYIPKNNQCVIYKGKKYRSRAELCRELNLSYGSIGVSLSRDNTTLEQAIEKELKRKVFIYKGKQYKSLNAVAKKFNININTLYKRMQNGMTLEQAIETPLLETQLNPYIYKGKKYKGLNAICREFNIPNSTLRTRLNSGWTLEQAIETPKLVNQYSKR